MNPILHAESSVQRWGGSVEDYLPLHSWFDATKTCLGDNRHRMVLHNAFGISLAEQVFGREITNSAGMRVFVRNVAEQHILEDLGHIPSLSDCLRELPIRPWMAGITIRSNSTRRHSSADNQVQDQGRESDGGGGGVSGGCLPEGEPALSGRDQPELWRPGGGADE